MPRKITILLEAPPGDGLRPAREHFHEYVKPILVAGALDWEVIEGRREGEVRAGLAEKIRKMRQRNDEAKEKVSGEEGGELEAGQDEDLVQKYREKAGIEEWEGVKGDLILGRHTWKEYVRGLHEGWLGPLQAPAPAPPEVSNPLELDPMVGSPSLDSNETDTNSDKTEAAVEESKDKKSSSSSKSPAVPYILTAEYATSPSAPSLPTTLPPSTSIPLPHLLGLKHTPTRIYRFLTRRHLADSTGAEVAALVLATYSQPYQHTESFASAIDPDDNASPSSAPAFAPAPPQESAIVPTSQTWEQTTILSDEETGWHKSVRAPIKENEEDRERIWTDPIIIDERIGSRMRKFELEEGARQRAEEMVEVARKLDPSILEKVKRWTGWGPTEKKGWEMGEEGNEES